MYRKRPTYISTSMECITYYSRHWTLFFRFITQHFYFRKDQYAPHRHRPYFTFPRTNFWGLARMYIQLNLGFEKLRSNLHQQGSTRPYQNNFQSLHLRVVICHIRCRGTQYTELEACAEAGGRSVLFGNIHIQSLKSGGRVAIIMAGQ